MTLKSLRAFLIFVLTIVVGAACTPKAAPTPETDSIGTIAAQLAMVMLTQTAGAHSPTPPPPTVTLTPAVTDTPAPPPTSSEKPKRPFVTEFTGCWTGPGENFTLISNIDPKKYVEIIGIGTEPGWHIIRNPYFHNPCWIQTAYLKIDPNLDLSKLPVMTPGP